MSIYITSDLHLGHKRIGEYCKKSRGHFVNEIEMSNWIIDNWNNTVAPEDEVWLLGDICLGSKENMEGLISRLGGRKRLVLGNHDSYIRKSPILQAQFETIDMYKEITVNVDGEKHFIVLSHYPILYWNRLDYGSIHLHGHTHGSPTNISGRIKDIGMDTNNLNLYVLEDVVRDLIRLPIGTDRHKNNGKNY